MGETEDVLAVAVRLARAAGEVQRDRYETQIEIHTKSADIDLVTEVDRECEAMIVGALARERPVDAILAEEGGGCGVARGVEVLGVLPTVGRVQERSRERAIAERESAAVGDHVRADASSTTGGREKNWPRHGRAFRT